MIQRSLRYVLATLVVLALSVGGGYWYLKRPAPEPTLELLTPADGAAMTRVIPGNTASAGLAEKVGKSLEREFTEEVGPCHLYALALPAL